jgi:hypothetical protein
MCGSTGKYAQKAKQATFSTGRLGETKWLYVRSKYYMQNILLGTAYWGLWACDRVPLQQINRSDIPYRVMTNPNPVGLLHPWPQSQCNSLPAARSQGGECIQEWMEAKAKCSWLPSKRI